MKQILLEESHMQEAATADLYGCEEGGETSETVEPYRHLFVLWDGLQHVKVRRLEHRKVSASARKEDWPIAGCTFLAICM